jgi:septal ring factor EnvC (AmiA/AmiB activator)
MDPEISKLGEFSTTLTHVLIELERKFKDGKDGSGKLAAIQSNLERHSAAIQSLEQTRDENRGTLDEALTAHAQMGRNVIEMTSTQCSDIQKSLVELRNDTKNDLNRLQGTLQVHML